MPTPGELLKEALNRAGVEQAEFGRRLGFTTPYQTVHRWVKDSGFNEENQKRAAEELGLPVDYFSAPDTAAMREHQRARVFADFLRTEIGSSCSAQERQVLGGVRFPDGITPSVAMFQTWALALRSQVAPEKVAETIEANERLDAEIARKSKRRK